MRHQEAPTNPTRITGPADLLGSVPALLGFHPHRSLVLVGLQGTRLVVTARLDLDDADEPLLARSLGSLARAGVDRVVAAVYDDPGPTDLYPRDPRTARPSELPTLLRAAATGSGIELLDLLLVTGRRWRSAMCSDTTCCPPDGSPLPPAPTVATTRAAYDGTVVADSRDALAERFAPEPGREALHPCIELAEQARLDADRAGRGAEHDHELLQSVLTAHRAGVPLTERRDELAGLAIALTAVEVRDPVWLAVDDGQLAEAQVWLELSRLLPAPWNAGPLFLYAWSAWRDGNGALAAIAIDHALEADPAHRAAALLQTALTHGIDPSTVPTLRPRTTRTRT